MADESQSARLAPERAAADAQKKPIVGLEGGGTEVADQGLPLFMPVFGDGVDDVLTQSRQGGEVGHLARPEFLGESEFGPGPQPA